MTLSVQKDHEQVLVKKMLADFEKAKVSITERQLRKQLTEFQNFAATQVRTEVKS